MANVYEKDGAFWGRVREVFGRTREVRLTDVSEAEAFRLHGELERRYIEQCGAIEDLMSAVIDLEESRRFVAIFARPQPSIRSTGAHASASPSRPPKSQPRSKESRVDG